MPVERTPWLAWLGAALRCGLPPSDFWALSLREWRTLVAPHSDDVLGRAEFDALVARFPDHMT